MSHLVSFCWIRITQYIPELGLNYKEGGKLWKVVERNNRSGSYIFNWCSVLILGFILESCRVALHSA